MYSYSIVLQMRSLSVKTTDFIKMFFCVKYVTVLYLSLICVRSVFSDEGDEDSTADKDNIACLNSPECEVVGKKGKEPGGQASLIAQKAAQEAKAAEDAQQQAGQQAAKQVKQQLAEKAMEAAKAAEAALSGKEALVSQIQEELKEAEIVVSIIKFIKSCNWTM